MLKVGLIVGSTRPNRFADTPARWLMAHQGSVAASSGLCPRMLRRALIFMELNLGERFSLGELAMWVGVSRFHFARLFRASTGHSPMQYLVSKRVERSKTLLVRDEYSICRVATLLGFCDQSHFTRTFRRLTGCTPSEFVQRARAGSDAGGITAEGDQKRASIRRK